MSQASADPYYPHRYPHEPRDSVTLATPAASRRRRSPSYFPNCVFLHLKSP